MFRIILFSLFSALALGAFVVPSRSVAQDDEATWDRADLWNECKGVYLTVLLDISNSSFDLSLSKETLTNSVESKLRADGIYLGDYFVGMENATDGYDSFLAALVGIRGNASLIRVSLFKPNRDLATEVITPRESWTRSVWGTYEDDAIGFLADLSELIDLFINEYLRVNESACS